MEDLRSKPNRAVGLLGILMFLVGSALSVDGGSSVERDFTLKVLPLLKTKCFACHGEDPKQIKGGLDMLTREGLLRGGENLRHVVVPGDAGASALIEAVTWTNPDLEMPPKENDRLTAEQIADVRAWIDAGAPWPGAEVQRRLREAEWAVVSNADGVIVKTSGGLAEEWTYRRYKPEDLWAFRPVKEPAVPSDSHPVDAFIDARLAAAGTKPAPPASPLSLIRRATFDLIGLPPTPEEVAAFEAAWNRDSRAAWVDLIDRLLASPHYGERWAQHWFDVTRYADTGGMANDFERSNMWRYRDYVIRAFNDDKPYDRFVIEQLAGDELADAAALERLGGDAARLAEVRRRGDYSESEARLIVASGFLRLGPWDNAMVSESEARQIYLDDLVNVVGQTFLSTTMRCFKCHDHKFDPLPTRDYYRVYAAFSGTQMAERPLRFIPEENRAGFEEGRKFVQRMLNFATREKDALVERREAAARAWFQERGLEYVPEPKRKDLPDEQKPLRNVGLDHVAEGQLKVREQDEWIWTRALERFEPMVQGVYDGAAPPLAWNGARKLRMPDLIHASWRPTNHILIGGSLEARGAEVGPGILSALQLPADPGHPHEDPYLLPETVQVRRLALAKWIAHPLNPLATRSIVNRVWQHHFGRPLAANPNNFGVKGAKPTHPELLDWLASDFVGHGWTLKRLHRLIMTSAAYQRSSRHPDFDRLREVDPNNHLLACFPPRRLTAEEMRDAMLAVTGELNPAMGGLPVMPEINMEVALQPRMIQFSLAPSHQPSRTPAERNRRSIYTYRVRGQADPFLEVFNQPNPNDSCEERDVAAVSPQAFTLLNSDLMGDRALAIALRLEREADSRDARVRRAFRLTLGRPPTDGEERRMTAYLDAMAKYHEGVNPEPVRYPVRVTRSLVEEFSGTTFEYEEILPVFEDYVPDAKPSDASPGTRALADLCLLLFNSHEFIHLD